MTETYYQKHKKHIMDYEKERYREMIRSQGKEPRTYREKKGYIISNENETKYFETLRETADFLGVDKSLVYYKLYKAKKDTRIKGWDLDTAL